MKNNTYFFLAASINITLTLFLLVLIVYGLSKVLPKTDFSPRKQSKILIGTVLCITAWVVLVSMLTIMGWLADFSTFPPRPVFLLLTPLYVFLYLIFFSKNFRQIILHVPSEWMIYIQTFRIPVEIFLWLLFLGNWIPIQMSFEGRNFDILTGLTAPLVAYFCYSRRRWSTSVVFYWNFFGMALLINILAVAVLSMPTPMRMFMNEPSNTIVATFPMVLLPSILVPIAYGMHFFSWYQVYLIGRAKSVKNSPQFSAN
jgi:hypothetical protein